ncbi:MAG: pyruvate kinase [Gammaproteobacteria bacterium]
MSINTQIDLLNQRRTKIIATLGPSSNDENTIRHLLEAGVDVIRLNMSHGTHKDHEITYKYVRDLAAKLNRPVAIFADLCGPKIRTGKFKNDQIELTNDEEVTITTRDIVGEPGLIPSQYKALAQDVMENDRILMDDGKLELRVESVAGEEITCRVIQGGTLKNHKGINLPGVNVTAPSLTEKDEKDAAFALKLGVDFLALSFVRRAEDIHKLRKLMEDQNLDAGIIAKFEKPEALENASDIIRAVNAVMVARGDLGVELTPEEVPIAQRKLITMARDLNCPVIVATQMLESMIEIAQPTRAEVSDVSQAVHTGADAVMLSGETAAGKHPIRAVRMMSRIIHQTEAYMWQENRFSALERDLSEYNESPFGHAVANITAELAQQLQIKAILTLSQSGMSAVTISSARPAAHMIAISSDERIYRRTNLLWGTLPILAKVAGTEYPNLLARQVAKDAGFANDGEYIILIRGFHAEAELNTPSVTLLTV